MTDASLSELDERPLASWKTWWSQDIPKMVAKSLQQHIETTKLPGGGRLLTTTSFSGELMKDPHVGNVAEGLLLSYPKDHQPSAYLLGDSVLYLDLMWKGALLGGQQKSALKEKVRRDTALAEGSKMKKLLSYIRTSALKADQGKTPEITYLKSLANERQVKVRRSSSASSTCSGSHRSDTTLELGSLEFATEIILFFFILQFPFINPTSNI